MDEKDKAWLAQVLKGQLTDRKRPGPAMSVSGSTVRPDLAPLALAACAADIHLHRRIDEALRLDDPAWNAQVAGSALVHQPALLTLPIEVVPYAFRLVGVFEAARHDQRAQACLGEIVRDGWRRAWQTVNADDTISLERFRAMHPGERSSDLDVELLMLTWYAGLRGIPVAESPLREKLDTALTREVHRCTLEAAKMDAAHRSRYDAALKYGHAWWRATTDDEGENELSAGLTTAREVLSQATHAEYADLPGASDVWQMACLLAGADAGLDDGTAVSMLAGLFALRRQPVPVATVSDDSPPPSGPSAVESELRKTRAELATQLRDVRRLNAELERTRERLSAREAEISRLLGILAARAEPEPEVQYTVHPISERVLVVGGHETLSRNLQAWLPDSICIATNGKEDLDPAVLSTTRLVVVLTSYISHSFSGKVINEAHKRDLPILMLDWRSAKHILQEIERALTAQQDTSGKR